MSKCIVLFTIVSWHLPSSTPGVFGCGDLELFYSMLCSFKEDFFWLMMKVGWDLIHLVKSWDGVLAVLYICESQSVFWLPWSFDPFTGFVKSLGCQGRSFLTNPELFSHSAVRLLTSWLTLYPLKKLLLAGNLLCPKHLAHLWVFFEEKVAQNAVLIISVIFWLPLEAWITDLSLHIWFEVSRFQFFAPAFCGWKGISKATAILIQVPSYFC